MIEDVAGAVGTLGGGMLGSLNGILVAATRSDSGPMHRAAAASGMAMAADPTLERYLPEQFLQLGTTPK
jgi:hypothetical protein